MSNSTVYFDGKDRGLADQARKQAAAADDIGRSYRETTREMNKLEREIKRGFRDAQPEAEQHARKIRQLDDLLKRGRISQKEYNFAVREMGQTQNKVFGSALSALPGVLGLTTGIAAAARGVVQALEAELAARKEIQSFISASETAGLAELAQLAIPSDIAGKTPAQLQAQTSANLDTLKAATLAAANAGVGDGESLDAAKKLVFSIVSASGFEGLRKDGAFFNELAASKTFREPGTVIDAISQLQTQLGTAETGDARAIVSKALAGSGGAPALAEEIIGNLSTIAAPARALGLSDEELIAAQAVIAKGEGGAAAAGTKFGSLGFALGQGVEIDGDTRTFVGKSLREAVTEIAGENLSFDELFKALGRKEAVVAFNDLANNLEEYDKRLQIVNDAQQNDFAGLVLGAAAADPLLASGRGTRTAELQRKVDNLELGIIGNNIDTLETQQRRLRGESGFLATANWFRSVGEASVTALAGGGATGRGRERQFVEFLQLASFSNIDNPAVTELQRIYQALVDSQVFADDDVERLTEALQRAQARADANRQAIPPTAASENRP